MNRLLLLSLLAVTLAACQTPETEPANDTTTPTRTVADTDADRAAIEAMTARYTDAVQAGDHDAVAALYADDAVIHPANEPSVSGREALDTYFATENAEPIDYTFTTEEIVVSEAGDMAYEVGTYSDGQSKYLTVYRKTADGWHIVADSWSSNAPPTAAN